MFLCAQLMKRNLNENLDFNSHDWNIMWVKSISYRIRRFQTRRLHTTLWISLRHFKFLRNSPLKFATGDQSVAKSQAPLVDHTSKLSFDRGSIWMRGRLWTRPKWTMEESVLQANSSGLVANALIMRWHLNASTVGQRGGSRDRSRSRMLI